MHVHSDHDKPSDWVLRFAPMISRGHVLDLACGTGRHARLLAAMGHNVLAVDRDAVVLGKAAGAGITTLECDLENDDGANASGPFAANHFAGVVVTNYLHRPLFPRILGSIRQNGVLIYETFAVGNACFGKPSNPDFLLANEELLSIVKTYSPYPLRVIAFEDVYVQWPKPAMVQRICAIRTDG